MKVLLIAEIGIAHCGRPDLARLLIHEASMAGATAVKFQIYSAAQLWTEDAEVDKRQRNQLPADEYVQLAEYANSLGLKVGASFFGRYGASVSGHLDFLKIAARCYPEQDEALAGTRIPVYASCRRFLPVEPRTGWVYLACSDYPDRAPFVYPTRAVHYFLNAGLDWGPWGYSSHSPHELRGEDCLRAFRQGASVIEKHFCLDRTEIPVDQKHSLTPAEFESLAKRIYA